MSAVFVLFDPVKSADPPTVSGITGLTACKVFSEAERVASFGLDSAASFLMARIAAASFLGASPEKARLNCA